MTTSGVSAEDRALLSGWLELDGGFHVTRSERIIQQALRTVQKQHIFCSVVAKGYESGKVVIVEFGGGRIVLDRPVDWPSGMGPQPLRILFKDRAQLWNQLAVKLLEVTDESIITTMPLKYVRLQRRSNYRVDVPRGSKVVFRHRNEVISHFTLANISADGSLVILENQQAVGLEVGDLLSEIALSFPCGEDEPIRVRIKEGRVVRTCENERREPCFGVHFLLQPREEKDLMSYVRLRERELLRKGMAEE